MTKPYTPVSSLKDLGSVVFVIKMYREHPDFPGGGKFTQELEKVQVGDAILCEGPVGKLKYHGNGEFKYMAKTIPDKKWIGLIAGGTGITPCYSIAAASVLANDGMDVKLVFSNKTKGDILCENEL